MNIKTIIADGQPIVTNGLNNVLSQTGHIQVTGVYHTTATLLQSITYMNADVLILDKPLQETDIADTVSQLNKIAPQLRILMFSNNNTVYQVKKMLEAGCLGYLLKDADHLTLINAVETVFHHRRYLTPSLEDALQEDALVQKSTAKKSSLTRREKEVLELIVNEYTNPEIAAKLFLSPSTIESHRTNIQHKLGAKNTAGIVRLAFQAGLV